MKKHFLLLIAAILLLFVSSDLSNPSPDSKQNHDAPTPQIINIYIQLFQQEKLITKFDPIIFVSLTAHATPSP